MGNSAMGELNAFNEDRTGLPCRPVLAHPGFKWLSSLKFQGGFIGFRYGAFDQSG